MAKAAKKKSAAKKITPARTAGTKAAAGRRLKRSVAKPAKQVARKTATKSAPKKAATRPTAAKKAAAKAPVRRAAKSADRLGVLAQPAKTPTGRRLARRLRSEEPKLAGVPLAPARKAPRRKSDLALPVRMPLDVPLRPDNMRAPSQSYRAVRLIDKE